HVQSLNSGHHELTL
ncbi:hypothetical protein CPC197_0766B, partial [Chlamydia psittaci C1/97]